MPAFETQAVPDKAMTLDLAALRGANSAAAAPSPATKTAAAPVRKPASAAPASPAAETDFSEPENPWAPAEPSRPAANSPVAAETAAPATTVASVVSGPPQNPWVQIAASRTAVYPPVPPEISQYVPFQPAASVPVAVQSAPAASSAAPAQRQCFTNTEGVKICYMDDEQHHNVTDVHKEGGVNDYHNQASASEKEAIQGHIPGSNVTATINNLGSNPPPNEHKDGNTVFQGKHEADIKVQHDIHKDNSTYTEHGKINADGDTDWKSAYKGPDGSKEMSEIEKDFHGQGEEDMKVDAEGKDKVNTAEMEGSDDHRFMSDKPGTKDDSSLVWNDDWKQKSQKEEFQGKGVYDLHEETSSERKIQAKVDGDQGWRRFQQDMDDFDTIFDGDDAWKERMKNPRAETTAVEPKVVAAPTLTSVVAKRSVPTAVVVGDEVVLLPTVDGETFAVQKREELLPAKCEHGESQWHCACRLGQANAYPCVAIFGVARPTMEQGPKHLKEGGKLPLIARYNPWARMWDDWKENINAWEEDEAQKKSDAEHGYKHDDGRSDLPSTPEPVKYTDGSRKRAVTPSGFDTIDGLFARADEDAAYEPLLTVEPRQAATLITMMLLEAAEGDDSNAADQDGSELSQVLFWAFLVLLIICGVGLGYIAFRSLRVCLQRRKERLRRQAYIQEIEGVHVVECPQIRN